jgi:hypothetical protein
MAIHISFWPATCHSPADDEKSGGVATVVREGDEPNTDADKLDDDESPYGSYDYDMGDDEVEHPAPKSPDEDEELPSETGTPEPSSGGVAPERPVNEFADYPPELLQRAVQYGYTAADVAELGTPGALRAALRHTDRTLQMLAQTQPEKQPEPLPDYALDAAKLKASGFDEELIDELGKLTTTLKQREAAQQQVVEQLRQQVLQIAHLQQSQQQAETERLSREKDAAFDDWLESLPKEWETIFGKGRLDKLDRNSVELSNRLSLFEKAEMLEAMYRLANRQVPPRSKLYREARDAVFGERSLEIAREQIKNGVTRRQTVARPTNNTPVGQQPERQAIDAIDAWRKVHGLA